MDNADALPAGRTADGAAVSQFGGFGGYAASLASDGAYVRLGKFACLRGNLAKDAGCHDF